MYTPNSDEYIMYVLMILKTARLIEENKHHFLMIEIIIIIYRASLITQRAASGEKIFRRPACGR